MPHNQPPAARKWVVLVVLLAVLAAAYLCAKG